MCRGICLCNIDINSHQSSYFLSLSKICSFFNKSHNNCHSAIVSICHKVQNKNDKETRAKAIKEKILESRINVKVTSNEIIICLSSFQCLFYTSQLFIHQQITSIKTIQLLDRIYYILLKCCQSLQPSTKIK